MKLSASKRDITGKKVKHLRRDGIVPATVYGPSIDSINIQVNSKDMRKAFESQAYHKFVNLDIDGKETRTLIKNIEVHPITGEYLSVSFYKPDDGRKLAVEIPIIFEGTPMALKTKSGFLVEQFNAIQLYCLPKDLPESLVVNIEKLAEPGDSISAGDLELPEGVEFHSSVGDPNAVSIVYIAAAQKEIIEEDTTTEEEGAEEGAEGEKQAGSEQSEENNQE